MKCRERDSIIKDNREGYDQAEKEKLVKWDTYHGLLLTEAGKNIRKNLKGDFT